MNKKVTHYFIFCLCFFHTIVQAQQNYELSNPVSGTNVYIAPDYVRMLPGFRSQPTGTDYTLAKINPYILSGGTVLPNDIDPPAESSSELPGILHGELDVSPTGAATYQIPVKAVPGTAGMTPQLSITYKSQVPNGLLGVGWSISGLSTISRAASKMYYDNEYNPVDLSLNDKFELDGQRLILVSGIYGQDGSEYKTETNDFSRVIAYGGNGTGPEKFKVWTKSGLIKEYGYTNDSRIEAQGKTSVLYWKINKIMDSKGNYINFYYTESNAGGEYRPDRIEYTGNVDQGLLPYGKIEFVYESRSDQTTFYLSGSKSTVSQRLREIRCFYEGSIVKRYRLLYAYLGDNNRSHLTSIREYGNNGSKSFKPTTFEWKIAGTAVTNQIYDQSYYAENYATHTSRFFLGDFNGDGRQDILTVANTGHSEKPTWTGWRLFTAKEDGIGFQYKRSGTLPDNFKDIFTGDFNGDGYTDFLVSYGSNLKSATIFDETAISDSTETLAPYQTVYDKPKPPAGQDAETYGYTNDSSTVQDTALSAPLAMPMAASSSDPLRKYKLYL